MGFCEEYLALCVSMQHTDKLLSERTGEQLEFSVVIAFGAEELRQRNERVSGRRDVPLKCLKRVPHCLFILILVSIIKERRKSKLKHKTKARKMQYIKALSYRIQSSTPKRGTKIKTRNHNKNPKQEFQKKKSNNLKVT